MKTKAVSAALLFFLAVMSPVLAQDAPQLQPEMPVPQQTPITPPQPAPNFFQNHPWITSTTMTAVAVVITILLRRHGHR